ncbi:hypothetical protein AGR4C_Lc130164 [Agrobacterium tumefaciens str. Kerr 14]|uniref:Uncharacterized protein n=1 Tax=Agrobacterium tumefaciens str. Kerr 14 TaxID=1183424 RepID=A0A1S7RES2_AGRTU|nr:hypothetical protein AGR4C_Lc130164 [Agrobacterium tumefaciens str. Kerr 14]
MNVFVVDSPVGTEAEGAIQSGFIGRSPLIAFGITEIRLAALGHARTVSLAVARFADALAIVRTNDHVTAMPDRLDKGRKARSGVPVLWSTSRRSHRARSR